MSRREAIHAKFGGKCAYCGQPIDIKKMQVDHIYPKFRGGTDEDCNLHPACASCNNWKHSFSLEEFRRELEAQHDRLVRFSAGYRIASRFGLVSRGAERVVFHFEKGEAPEIPWSDIFPDSLEPTKEAEK